jgi:hypothetical protein
MLKKENLLLKVEMINNVIFVSMDRRLHRFVIHPQLWIYEKKCVKGTQKRRTPDRFLFFFFFLKKKLSSLSDVSVCSIHHTQVGGFFLACFLIGLFF